MYLLSYLQLVNAHGAMTEPPARNYLGYPSNGLGYKYCMIPEALEEEYNWMGLGHASVPGDAAKRGVVDNNDLKPHEVGPACGNGGNAAGTKKRYGEFATDKFGVTKAYAPGSTLKLEFTLTAPHVGHHWFDFACFDGKESMFANDSSISWKRLSLASGGTTIRTFDSEPKSVVLPNEKCNHGVLQWTWFGEQSPPAVECFFNCADIKIGDEEGFQAVCPSGESGSSGVAPKPGSPDTSSGTKGPSQGDDNQTIGSGEDDEDVSIGLILAFVGVVICLAGLIAWYFCHYHKRKDQPEKETPMKKSLNEQHYNSGGRRSMMGARGRNGRNFITHQPRHRR